MLHTVSFASYHGNGSVTLRGPAKGFVLSEAQVDKWRDAWCGVSTCKCSLDHYRADDRGAAIVPADDFTSDGRRLFRLIPESERVGSETKRGPGRPKTREGARINTEVDVRTKRALEDEAAARGTSVARLIDQLVMCALPERFDRDD